MDGYIFTWVLFPMERSQSLGRAYISHCCSHYHNLYIQVRTMRFVINILAISARRCCRIHVCVDSFNPIFIYVMEKEKLLFGVLGRKQIGDCC
jgi:hypothetical protein